MNRYLILAEYFDNDTDQFDYCPMFRPSDFSGAGQIWGIHAHSESQAMARASQIWQESLGDFPNREFIRFLVVEYDDFDSWGDKRVVDNWPDKLVGTSVYRMFKSASAR